jgi:hypothetical protein
MQWCETPGCPRRVKPGTKKCAGCRKQEWKEKYPEKAFEYDLARYGVTPYWYETKLAEQNGVCAICKKPETAKQGDKVQRLSVDHDHTSNQPRGLLCAACNRAIGLMKEDPARFEAAARYLMMYKVGTKLIDKVFLAT